MKIDLQKLNDELSMIEKIDEHLDNIIIDSSVIDKTNYDTIVKAITCLSDAFSMLSTYLYFINNFKFNEQYTKKHYNILSKIYLIKERITNYIK